MDARSTVRPDYWPLKAFLVASIALGTASLALFGHLYETNKTAMQKELTSIGLLKTQQIRSYLDERRGDATDLSNFLTLPLGNQWLTQRAGADLPAELRQPLQNAISTNLYGGVLVLDDAARRLFGAGVHRDLSDGGQAAALAVLRGRSPVEFRIHFGDPAFPDKPLLDIFVPIADPETGAALGVLVLRDNLHFLYRLISTWPGDSATAETLLVAAAGGEVVFLSELRHQKDAALTLRKPLDGDVSTPAWPAIRAARGRAVFSIPSTIGASRCWPTPCPSPTPPGAWWSRSTRPRRWHPPGTSKASAGASPACSSPCSPGWPGCGGSGRNSRGGHRSSLKTELRSAPPSWNRPRARPMRCAISSSAPSMR